MLTRCIVRVTSIAVVLSVLTTVQARRTSAADTNLPGTARLTIQ